MVDKLLAAQRKLTLYSTSGFHLMVKLFFSVLQRGDKATVPAQMVARLHENQNMIAGVCNNNHHPLAGLIDCVYLCSDLKAML